MKYAILILALATAACASAPPSEPQRTLVCPGNVRPTVDPQTNIVQQDNCTVVYGSYR